MPYQSQICRKVSNLGDHHGNFIRRIKSILRGQLNLPDDVAVMVTQASSLATYLTLIRYLSHELVLHIVKIIYVDFYDGWKLFVLDFIINTLRPRQNGRHFADDIFKRIFLNGNIWISIDISLRFVPRDPIGNV